jgi:hypothetical protein
VSQKTVNGKVSRLKLLSLPSDFYSYFVQVVALFARDHHKNIKRITRPMMGFQLKDNTPYFGDAMLIG